MFIFMESQFPFFLFLSTFLPLLFIALKRINTSKPNNSTSKLPPGPWKLPLIGNIHQLITSFHPHSYLCDLAKIYGPLMHLKLGQVSTMVVSSPEIAKEVLKTHDLEFAQRSPLFAAVIISYGCTNIVFSPYGGYWRQLRKICTMELLNPKRVKSFQSIREEEVSGLIKSISLKERSPINFSEMIFPLTYGVTSRAAFGQKYKDQDLFTSVIEDVARLAAGFSISDFFPSVGILQTISLMKPKLEKLHKMADGILQSIIDEHRRRTIVKHTTGEEKEDLVDVLLRIQAQGDLDFPLSDDNIKSVILDMFAAGSETSSTTVEWAMSEMLKNPSIMEKAQAEVRQVFKAKGDVDESCIHELKYLKSVIKETMRLHPSVTLIPRESRTSTEINGYNIPAKTKIIVNVWAIGRDPKHWTEADKFNPDRFLDGSIDYKGTDIQFIPFGSGRRICPGISYAMANIELPLAQLLYHFDWKLPNEMKPEDLDMTEGYGLTVRRKRDLFLVPISYHPFSVE